MLRLRTFVSREKMDETTLASLESLCWLILGSTADGLVHLHLVTINLVTVLFMHNPKHRYATASISFCHALFALCTIRSAILNDVCVLFSTVANAKRKLFTYAVIPKGTLAPESKKRCSSIFFSLPFQRRLLVRNLMEPSRYKSRQHWHCN